LVVQHFRAIEGGFELWDGGLGEREFLFGGRDFFGCSLDVCVLARVICCWTSR
jgi:hypothetical protein